MFEEDTDYGLNISCSEFNTCKQEGGVLRVLSWDLVLSFIFEMENDVMVGYYANTMPAE